MSAEFFLLLLFFAALKLNAIATKEKEEYITNLFMKIVQINPEGVTISQLKEAVGLSSSTIWHHLEILKSISIISMLGKISRGNVDVLKNKIEMLINSNYQNFRHTTPLAAIG